MIFMTVRVAIAFEMFYMGILHGVADVTIQQIMCGRIPSGRVAFQRVKRPFAESVT